MGRTEILEHRAPKGNAVSGAQSGLRHGIGWLPLVILPLLAILFHGRSRPWVFLGLLAAAIFAGCKWQTWWAARIAGTVAADRKRNAAYLLLWPGGETREFFNSAVLNRRVPPVEWCAAMAKTLAGIALIAVGARVVFLGHPMRAAI